MNFWNNGIKAVVVDGTNIADIELQPEYTVGLFPSLRTPCHGGWGGGGVAEVGVGVGWRYIEKQLTGLYMDFLECITGLDSPQFRAIEQRGRDLCVKK